MTKTAKMQPDLHGSPLGAVHVLKGYGNNMTCGCGENTDSLGKVS